jgi:hypothetical protein
VPLLQKLFIALYARNPGHSQPNILLCWTDCLYWRNSWQTWQLLYKISVHVSCLFVVIYTKIYLIHLQPVETHVKVLLCLLLLTCQRALLWLTVLRLTQPVLLLHTRQSITEASNVTHGRFQRKKKGELSSGLSKDYVIKSYGEWSCKSNHFQIRHYIETNGQIHAPAVLASWKAAPESLDKRLVEAERMSGRGGEINNFCF